MRQHARDDAIGALAVLGDLAEVANQEAHRLVQFGTLVVVERGERRTGNLFQFVEQLNREASEVVDEVEWVLDLVRYPSSELAERSQLLRLDQAALCGAQVVQRLGQLTGATAQFVE